MPDYRLRGAEDSGLSFDHLCVFHPQVITPVRTGHGYVYEYPARYQKDVYDVPPSHTTQGVSNGNATRGASFRGSVFRTTQEKKVTVTISSYAALSCLPGDQASVI